MVTRAAAAVATVVTTILLQATVVGPLGLPLPVNLPLVAVLAVAVVSGPSAGITLGFGAGLVLDLGSTHPVGVLAALWLGAGLVGGWLGGLVHRVRPRAALVGALGGLTAAVTAVVLALLGASTGPLPTLLLRTVPATLLDAILALAVVPAAAAALRSPALRWSAAGRSALRPPRSRPTLPLST